LLIKTTQPKYSTKRYPDQFVVCFELLTGSAISLGKANCACKPPIRFGSRTFQIARKLGGNQSFRHALHFHPGKCIWVADPLLDIFELLGSRIVRQTQSARVSNLLPNPEVVERKVQAITADNLLNDPTSVEISDNCTIFLGELVLDPGAILRAGKLSCNAIYLLIAALRLHDACNIVSCFQSEFAEEKSSARI